MADLGGDRARREAQPRAEHRPGLERAHLLLRRYLGAAHYDQLKRRQPEQRDEAEHGRERRPGH